MLIANANATARNAIGDCGAPETAFIKCPNDGSKTAGNYGQFIKALLSARQWRSTLASRDGGSARLWKTRPWRELIVDLRQIIVSSSRIVVRVSAVVAISFHGESMKPSGAFL
jgi:hypothetical protein